VAQKGDDLPRRGRSEEQIIAALRQVEIGVVVKEVGRQVGISESAFDTRKRKYAGIRVSELRELRHLREENAKLKWLVADLGPDKRILQDEQGKKV
jgi:putative transposase